MCKAETPPVAVSGSILTLISSLFSLRLASAHLTLTAAAPMRLISLETENTMANRSIHVGTRWHQRTAGCVNPTPLYHIDGFPAQKRRRLLADRKPPENERNALLTTGDSFSDCHSGNAWMRSSVSIVNELPLSYLFPSRH